MTSELEADGEASFVPEELKKALSTSRCAVVGNGGSLSREMVDVLYPESREVWAVDIGRSAGWAPQGVELFQADPSQASSITEGCRGADMIYDCYEPSHEGWKNYWEVTGNVLLAAIELESPGVFSSHIVKSERDNTGMEKDLLNAHGSGLTRTTVARFPQMFGVGVMNTLFELVFGEVERGGKAHWVGDLDVPRTFLDVRDAARAMALIGGRSDSFGKVWNVASPTTLTGREFVELAFRTAGKEPKVAKWGRGIVMTGSLLAADARAVLDMPYDYYSPCVLKAREFADAFPNFAYTPPERTMAATMEWYRSGREGTRSLER